MEVVPVCVIGIAGPSGAGKSTIVTRIADALSPCAVLHLDDYFRHPDTFPSVDGVPNWDVPHNLDFKTLAANLDDLIAGRPTTVPVFNKRTYEQSTRSIDPAPLVIVEGFFLYCDSEVRARIGYRIWLDVSEDEQVRRRIGRDPSRADYIRSVVLPAFRTHGLPTRSLANTIIDASGSPEEVAQTALRAISARE
jgi:uridine kinase